MSNLMWEKLNTNRYYKYINNIINTRGQWNIKEGEYWEGHHIILKCKGGKGSTRKLHKNIIKLYAHEHFIVHKILAEDNPDDNQIVLAWAMMVWPKCNKNKRNYTITPEEYEQCRKLFSYSQSLIDRSSYNFSYLKSEEFRKILSDNGKGRKAYNNGVVEIHIKNENDLPEGFVKGALPNISWLSGKGKSYYNNGEITIRAYECPEGFIKGRLITEKIRTHNASIGVGRHWYNNGIINKFTFECPEGYIKGKLNK